MPFKYPNWSALIALALSVEKNLVNRIAGFIGLPSLIADLAGTLPYWPAGRKDYFGQLAARIILASTGELLDQVGPALGRG